MLTNRNKQILAITLVTAFVFMAVSPALVTVDAAFPTNLNVGPYIDKAVYKVISNQDQRILALQSGEIDFDNSFFDPAYLETLNANPDISIFTALRFGYGHLTINCRDYPLNISGLRRAFAFAFDKTRVASEVLNGFSQVHDSLVPYPNSWCIEDDMPYHYYTGQPDMGNQILDRLGFDIDPVSGFRTAPDGSPFNVVVEYSSSSPEIAGNTATIAVDALRALDIDAETRAADFNEYISRLDSHGEYDIVFFASNYLSNDVDWLAREFWSEYADTPYRNECNFVNETYDSWRDQLLYGTSYEEVYEAAAAMQMILHENVPRLVAYENTYLQGYRNDVFTGHVEDLAYYISGAWTMRKIHKIDGTRGGTVQIAIGQEPDSFNIFTTNSAYSHAILNNLWPSLYQTAPDLTPWPDLAENMVIETHAQNPDVPTGHTRFTVDIIQNATWTDGVSITAEDVAFTFSYAFESGQYGNPAAATLTDLVAAYAPTPYRAVIEFNTESYWHFSNFAYNDIIPKHIFNDVDGLGYEAWNTWNPVFDPAEPNVNAGPFIFTDFEAGEFYEISANPGFYYYPQDEGSPSTSTTGSETVETFNSMLALAAGAVGAAVVILVGGFVLLRQK